MAQDDLPAKSTLKSRRRKKPVFLDEQIQWQLRTTRYDRCEWCGLATLTTRGRRERRCTNCGAIYKLDGFNPQEWLEHKLEDLPIDVAATDEPYHRVIEEKNCYTLREAQIRSETGRGSLMLLRVTDPIFTMLIYWHRQGLLPEHHNGIRACEGGSAMHALLRDLRDAEVWTPDEPLNAMEVLARAYGTDDDMFAIMMG